MFLDSCGRESRGVIGGLQSFRRAEHKAAVKLFEDAASSDDAEIAVFARKTLPALKDHLERAEDVAKAK